MNILMRGWNLYHKAAMTLVVAFFFGLFLRALFSINAGGIATETEIIIPVAALDLWPVLTDNENRSRWEAHVIDLVRLRGEADEENSTRYVFWRSPRMKRWQSLEATLEAIPGRRFYLQRESDLNARWLDITLEPVSECSTRVHVREVFRPLNFGPRYWAFLRKGELKKRLENSAESLSYWAKRLAPCGATNTNT